MSALPVHFTVPGVPVPQGSKAAILVRGRPVIVEGNRAKLKPWRAQVADHAAAAMNGRGLFTGAVAVELYLYFPRPKAHYVAGKPERGLRDDAPTHVAKRPDVEKVARAVLDALSGVCYRDDAQVAELLVTKEYSDLPRAVVQLREVAYA